MEAPEVTRTRERVEDSHDVKIIGATVAGVVVWQCGRCFEHWIPPLLVSTN